MDAHLALNEIQPCLYIRAGFCAVLGHEDGPNELEYCVVWSEVCKLLEVARVSVSGGEKLSMHAFLTISFSDNCVSSRVLLSTRMARSPCSF